MVGFAIQQPIQLKKKKMTNKCAKYFYLLFFPFLFSFTFDPVSSFLIFFGLFFSSSFLSILALGLFYFISF